MYPLLAIANAMAADASAEGAAQPALDFLYVGSPGGMEETILARTEIPYRAVDSAPIRGAAPWKLAGFSFVYCLYAATECEARVVPNRGSSSSLFSIPSMISVAVCWIRCSESNNLSLLPLYS